MVNARCELNYFEMLIGVNLLANQLQRNVVKCVHKQIDSVKISRFQNDENLC